MMTEFLDHGGPVYDVEFHPHEFLLASASADKTVNFWDLESFNLVSKSEKDSGPVRYTHKKRIINDQRLPLEQQFWH